MSATATLATTMTELKPEPAHGSLWSNYGGSSVPLSSRYSTVDSGLPQSTSATAQHQPGRPRSSLPSVDHPYSYPRYPPDEPDAYERQHQHSSLGQHHSFPELKRPYPGNDHPPYQEIVQDLRDDASKLSVNHDHKLLWFRKVPDKHTIVDQHGRMQQLELTAQLHGMFFLSEMPSSTSDGTILQPELTCYRRNLFQISGSLITPRGQMSVLLADTGATVPVANTEVTISAIESVDGHPVRLIVIPWKTPPPNSPEIPQSPDQEPASLPLIPMQDDETDGEYAVYPIGWRRLQFRIATANNGRRKELQQHFVLHLKVMATLTDGTKIVLTEATTAPIVVRGRSPRNFQARKEIPLLGSSAGSRGQALVETGLGIVAGPLTAKPQDSKLRGLSLELPRSAFTFSATKLPGTPVTIRSNSYPTWNPPVTQMTSPATAAYPATTVSADPYQKIPLSGPPSYGADPQEMPLQTSMPSVQLSLTAPDQQAAFRNQYAFAQGTSAPSQLSAPAPSMHNLNIPRYIDDSPRPAKSPRHGSQQSVHSTGSITNNDASEYRYGPTYVAPNNGNPNEISSPTYGGGDANSAAAPIPQPQPPQRDYYPPTTSWAAATAGESNASVQAYHNTENRPYAYQDQYKMAHSMPPPLKSEQQQPQQVPVTYGNSVNHYAWSSS